MKQNLDVLTAARLLDKTAQWVRIGLQQQRLPIGTAVLMPGNRWSYHISAKRLAEYIGEEGVERAENMGDPEED